EAGSVKKAKLDGLKPERVEVFAGGLAVLQAAFEELDIAEMQFTEAALRDGVFYDMIGRNLEEDLRDQTTAQFQQRYHVSTNQAERVAKLAGYFLYNLAQTATVQELGYWSDYVRWAALLHEIGIDIAHTAYHKHTAYILAQADMPGFSRSEQTLLSELTLGHRGDLKKMGDLANHEPMWWHSILALRLAVLFCRARLPLELPLRTVLQEKNAGEYVLKISQNWLDSNPLTSSALQTESEQWQKLERSFSVETI
ncbi:exopolyphosphatase, partial [Kingella kingae]|nr:exopolyphosphatase [Kingella kingae]